MIDDKRLQQLIDKLDKGDSSIFQSYNQVLFYLRELQSLRIDNERNIKAITDADTEIHELQEQNKALIEDAERLAELLSIDIPPATEYEKKVARDVGDKYGYGAIMSALSNVWHIEKEHGENGAITIGHCYGTIKKVLQQHNDLMQEIGCSQK